MLDSLFPVRILTRYILKEVLAHALIGVVLFTFVIFMRDVGRILELVVRNSAPLPSVAELFFLTLPTALIYTLPMAVLVGILIGFSRMAADSEVTAMRASGIGSATFAGMVSLFVVGAWLLAMGNTIFLAPRSAAALQKLQESLKSSQASFAVQPRVFYENFNNYVLYVQDVTPASGGASVWNNVFLADIRNPSAPVLTIAEKAIVLSENPETLRLHLVNGSQHETLPRSPNQYNISTFKESDISIQIATEPHQPRDSSPVELTTSELLARAADPDPAKSRLFMVEFHRRLALATACLVLALVGIPLGLSSKKGGKSTGFVLTIGLVFLYYSVLVVGLGMARQGKVPPAIGVWMANAVFAVAGLILMWRVDRSSLEVVSVSELWRVLADRFSKAEPEAIVYAERRRTPRVARAPVRTLRFPLILDNYILKTFLGYLGLILSSFIVLMLVFTFFELLGDIIRNRVALITVVSYLLNLTPSMIYVMTPLSVLIAVLVTFSILQHSNELTAMKATGISVHRAVVPVLVIAFVMSIGLFFFEQIYLPRANTRQESLRNTIKGKPAQTFLRPERKWIFGENNTIYYYENFDPDQNEFVRFSAFQFEPKSFDVRQRIFASRAHWEADMRKWVLERGWSRQFQGESVAGYQPFDVATFVQISEPPSYFKKEVRLSSEMNYSELSRYIHELQQSGFDVVRLRVQLHKKFAFPLIVFVMSVLAVPFSLSAGKRGALTGIAVALSLAVIYWVAAGLFEALGNVNQLPAALAAWAPDLLFGFAGGYLIFKVPT